MRGLDLLDGTPVLDLKPYVPYCDAFPDAAAGWVDQARHPSRFSPTPVLDAHCRRLPAAFDANSSLLPLQLQGAADGPDHLGYSPPPMHLMPTNPPTDG